MSLRTIFMSYDVYERHAVVGRLLRESIDGNQPKVTVLDIGGRAELLNRFLPYRIVSVNPDGSGSLVGDGCALPMVDNAFDAVVSVDTLEHLPRENRLLFLQECLRVARRHVIVAAPFGSAEHKAREKQLNDLYWGTYGQMHTYLNEHVQYGLPDRAELDCYEQNLSTKSVQRYFAGDYVWQGNVFERAIIAHGKQGVAGRLLKIYNGIISLAVFHPIRLHDLPDETSNRFYLHLTK